MDESFKTGSVMTSSPSPLKSNSKVNPAKLDKFLANSNALIKL